MGWSRSRALGTVLGLGCLLLAAGGGPGGSGGRLLPVPSARRPEPPHGALAPTAAPLPVSGPGERALGRLGPAARAHRARTALGSAPAAGPSPWWLEAGPPVEVRIGGHAVPATAARLDAAALEGVEVGDRIRLALPEVGALDVVVQRIASPTPGVLQLQGHLADPAEDYPATLTLGPVFAFANVTTPTGAWLAEFERGSGWVLYDDLDDRLVDHGRSDERIPPGNGAAG